jgi:excisionase family DNA binding protein
MNLDQNSKNNASSEGDKRLMTVKEAASYLSLSKFTLYELASKRKIPHLRIGKALRFDIRALDTWCSRRVIKDINSLESS